MTLSAQTDTYEQLYMSLWELGARYSSFTRFRVIGTSQDERMIPMLEIGTGQEVLLCISGIQGTDYVLSAALVNMAMEYCRAWECNWSVEALYKVRSLFSEIRLCLIPMLNPDGLEIVLHGYQAIHSPICRQMLRMQETPHEEFRGNARGILLSHDFPSRTHAGNKSHGHAARVADLEPEVLALLSILREYDSVGLLTFQNSPKGCITYQKGRGYPLNHRSGRMARHMARTDSGGSFLLRQSKGNALQISHHAGTECTARYRRAKKAVQASDFTNGGMPGTVSLEEYYLHRFYQPAICIEYAVQTIRPPQAQAEAQNPPKSPHKIQETNLHTHAVQKLLKLPLEYLFLLCR
jgi:g-D-glutamyl-meso-diaminopimelate peptidase